jgi:hypothetical protein
MAAMPKGLVQAQPELKHLKTGDEVSLYQALEENKIINSSLEDLKSVLRFVMLKVGLRQSNLPDEVEKGVLIDHIIKSYGGHTCQEIRLAFEMAIAGKLTEYNSKGQIVTVDVNCYENFSCLYFSKIMNAYRSWAEEAYKFIPKKVIEIENKRELSDSDMENWIEETRRIVTDISKVFLIPVEIYDWLVENKKINLSKEEKLENIGQSIRLRHSQLTDLLSGRQNEKKELIEFTAMKEKGIFEGVESDNIKRIAKKISVFNYFIND